MTEQQMALQARVLHAQYKPLIKDIVRAAKEEMAIKGVTFTPDQEAALFALAGTGFQYGYNARRLEEKEN